MNNKNNTEPKLSPEFTHKQVFKHRFDESKANDLTHVVDSIGLLTERAKSVLYLLFGQFEDGTMTRYYKGQSTQ